MTVIAFPGTESPFPHVLDPLPDESLLGFMLRIDRANGWEFGGVSKVVATHTTDWRHLSATMWAAGTVWDLRRLAHLTRNPFEQMVGLTLLPDLRRAANDPDLSIAALGDAGHLRFCPRCLATTGTIPRFCFLPLMDVCPVHSTKLVGFCGRHGGPYPPEVVGNVVRCAGCQQDLAATEPEPVAENELEHLRDTWRAWTFLLGWKGDDIRGLGYRTIKTRKRGYPLHDVGRSASFEKLVSVFQALQIKPELVSYLEERPTPPCPNATCPRFLPPGDKDRLAREGLAERHCPECGTRFVGRRIVMTFDENHGSDHPSRHNVRKAQRRLKGWQAALKETCRSDLLEGRPITIAGCFKRADIPLNANLRASRVGLVAIVCDSARRQRLLNGTERLPFRSPHDGRVSAHCPACARAQMARPRRSCQVESDRPQPPHSAGRPKLHRQ